MRSVRIGYLDLIGALRGPVDEGTLVEQELGAFHPHTVILDLSPEELKGLQEYFAPEDSEPLVPLSTAEMGLARALSEFSDVRMPSPAFVAAVRWSTREGGQVLPLDENDESYADLFVKHVGYVDLVRRTRAEHALVKGKYPRAANAEDTTTLWSERMHRSKGSRKLWHERCEIAARRLKDITSGPEAPPFAAVIDFERWAEVRTLLEGPPVTPVRRALF